jgi:hypothetical protein
MIFSPLTAQTWGSHFIGIINKQKNVIIAIEYKSIRITDRTSISWIFPTRRRNRNVEGVLCFHSLDEMTKLMFPQLNLCSLTLTESKLCRSHLFGMVPSPFPSKYPAESSWKPLQDLPFVILYISHLFVILSLTIVYGIPSLLRKSPQEIHVTLTGEEKQLDKSSNHNTEISFIFGVIFLISVSSILSMAWVYVTSTMATKIVMFSLTSVILVNVIGGVGLFAFGKLFGGFTLLMIALFSFLFFLYVRSRIEFVAANLKVACKALMAMPYILGWSFFVLFIQVHSHSPIFSFEPFLFSRSSGVSSGQLRSMEWRQMNLFYQLRKALIPMT